MRYIVDHPQSYLEGVSLRQRESTGAPQSENDLAVVVYLKMTFQTCFKNVLSSRDD